MLPLQPTTHRKRRRAAVRRWLGVERLEPRMTPAGGAIDSLDLDPRQPSVVVEVVEPAVEVVEGQAGQAITLVLRISKTATSVTALTKPLEVTLLKNADYVSTSGVFPVGSRDGAQLKLLVTAVDDLLFEEAAEIFPKELVVTTPNNANIAVGSVQVTVRDNEQLRIVAADPSVVVQEGGPSQNVALTLSLSGSGQGPAMLAVPVSFRLVGNSDYTSTNASFAVGALDGTVQQLAVTAIDDLLFEPLNESFADQPLISESQDTRATADSVDVLVIDNDFFLAKPIIEEPQRPSELEITLARTREFDIQQPPFIYRRVVTELFLAGYGGGQISDVPRSNPSYFPWLPDHLADSLTGRRRAAEPIDDDDTNLSDSLANFTAAEEALLNEAPDFLAEASSRAWQRIVSERQETSILPASYESEAAPTANATTADASTTETTPSDGASQPAAAAPQPSPRD